MPGMFRFYIAAAFLLLAATTLSGQATIAVSPLDHVYADIDLVVAHGLVSRPIVGQRPYSRRQIARLIAEASRALDNRMQLAMASGNADGHGVPQSSILKALLGELRQEYAAELRFFGDSATPAPPWHSHLFSSTRLDFTRVSGSGRDIPLDNGIGKIDAAINPLVSNRQGRVFHEGNNLAVETTHYLQSRFFAVSLNPQFSVSDSADWKPRPLTRIQNAQLRLLLGNFAIDVGREDLVWGQGNEVGLLNSDNAPPLNLLKLSNDLPIQLPWLLRSLGPSKLSIFYSDLGAQQNFPHAYMVGYKISVAPTSQLELGTTIYSKSGGRGSPRGTFTARIIDLLPFLDASAYNNVIGTRGLFEFSDRYAGIDGRLRFPNARGLELFSEILLNDFDVRRLASSFAEDAAHVVGMRIPRLGKSQAWELSSEFHHTGIRVYRHHQFTSGQTFNRMLIGDQLGPDAVGAYFRVAWAGSLRQRWDVLFAGERRSDDQYVGYGPENGLLLFRRIDTRPKELRMRAVVTWSSVSRGPGIALTSQLGYERTRNFGFVDGAARTGGLARLGLEYQFR